MAARVCALLKTEAVWAAPPPCPPLEATELVPDTDEQEWTPLSWPR
jgi:hypothetical protein